MRFKVISAAIVACGLSAPATADPTVGFGLSLTFGSGGVDYGVGLRVFSDDREDRAAASLGVDYLFGSNSWRGTLGAAYLMDNSYVELNGGYNFTSGTFDFGFGAGGADTKARSAGAPAVVAPPSNGGGDEGMGEF